MTEPSDQSPDEPRGRALPASGVGPLPCTPSLEQLYQYMDGALDPGQQATVASHLDACGCCGELYHFQAGFRSLVEMRCQSDLPSDLADRVFGAIPDLRDLR